MMMATPPPHNFHPERGGDNIKTTNGMEMNGTHALVYFVKWLCVGLKKA